jgi:Ser/Thr protein kinase RdoA (MazF antagonist)
MTSTDRIPDFHDLTPDRVIGLVEEALGRQCTNLCRPMNSYINRVYELALADGSAIIAKFYRPGRWSEAALRDEHDFLLELTDLEIPVISPLPLENGQTLGVSGELHFAIFPKKGGRTCDEFTEEQWLAIGRLLGRVHAAGARRLPRDRPELAPGRATRQQVDFILAGGFIPGNLRQRYEEVTAGLIETISPAFAGREMIRIHGDCHFGNLIYRAEESFYLIDFDDMVVGPPVQDLWMLLPGRPRESAFEIELFLEGYETFRGFDQGSLQLIEALRAMRYIHFSAWCARQAADGGFNRLAPDWGAPAYWLQECHDLEEQLLRIRTDTKTISSSFNC